MTLLATLTSGLDTLGLALPTPAIEQLEHYLALLQKWNQVHNLTAIREPEKMISHHLLDSLAIVPYLQHCQRVLDVGSGGGLPGVPLAIACPSMAVTLLDSNSKKTAFQQQVMIELGLPNLQVASGRVEQHQPAQAFDGIVSRAFSEMREFVQLSTHLLAAHGAWYAMKGVYPHEELHALGQNYQTTVYTLQVPQVGAERHLVKIAPRETA